MTTVATTDAKNSGVGMNAAANVHNVEALTPLALRFD
jgi:hypothetical protein